MKLKSMNQAFERLYDPYRFNERRHMKSRKKKRIIKKWRKRFGPPMSEVFQNAMVFGSPMLLHLQKDDAWIGGRWLIPEDLP